ncbi:hypothetical protein ACHAXA_001397 [Cyclostephanos tholiformis]|uniref:C2H2-type domain-containing protein n=1 Tax=Cyclostephanos tholiformis TaxID=382380 RepID=A0ABD3RF21_9STRA
MSRQITQPVNQVRLTNVAVVRLNRNGHRFEVACYRNKIVNYRQGTETDLGEVLQTDRVFVNVARGEFANAKLLRSCFGHHVDEVEVCRIILDGGVVQVTDMERGARLENMAREISCMISERCIHPTTRRPYTSCQIRDAMRSCGYMVHPTRGAKQQFLDCVKLIRNTGVLELERAKMELALVLVADDEDDYDRVHDDDGGGIGGGGGEGKGKGKDSDLATRRAVAIELLTNAGIVPSDISPPPPTAEGGGGGEGGGNDDADRMSTPPRRIVFRSDPSLYRKMDEISRMTCVGGRLEIVRQVVMEEWGMNATTAMGGGGEFETEQRRRMDDDGDGIREEKEERRARKYDNNDDDGVDDDDSDIGGGGGGRYNISSIVHELRTNLVFGGGDNDDNARTSDDDVKTTTTTTTTATPSSRKKAQKAAQKKSKKAKRREREEVDERDKRIEAERVRQRERAERLGISTSTVGKGRGGGGESYYVSVDTNADAAAAALDERVDRARMKSGGEGGGGDVHPALRPCNTCGGAFTPGEYRLHFRSDWHGYNVKLKLRGVPPVSEREFSLCDSDVFLSSV